MRRSILMILQLVWFAIAILPILYGREVFIVRPEYAPGILMVVTAYFLISSLFILYDLEVVSNEERSVARFTSGFLATLPLWGLYFYLIWLPVSQLNVINAMSILVAIALLPPLLLFNGLLMGLVRFQQPANAHVLDKRKRRPHEASMPDVSNDQLLQLKQQRLSDKWINDEDLETMPGNDSQQDRA